MRTIVAAAFILAVTGGLARAQDAEAGARIFLKCRSCHQIGAGAQNMIGPVLNGVIGRHSGTAPGYFYSAANKNSGLTWDEPTFRDYIRDPKAKIPGTKMVFPGLKEQKDVDNLLAYLKSFDAEGKKVP